MKIKIDWDEWYPVGSISDDLESYGREFEISKEKYEYFTKVFEEFLKVQNELDTIYRESK
jgi:hypothetical protein